MKEEVSEKLIRLPETQAILGGISRSTLWRWWNGLGPTGFPKPVKIGRSVAFKRSEIMTFIYNLGQQVDNESD